MPKAKKHTYSYGFQLRGSDHWFSYPYILVELKNIGRMKEPDIKKLGRLLSKEGLSLSAESFGDIISNVGHGASVYDEKRHILFWVYPDFPTVYC